MESLRMMKSHGCKIGYPAHGVVIQNLTSKIDSELISKTRREAQVLAALTNLRQSATGRGKASVTVKELVTVMHGDELDPQVREMAVEPFMDEVLRKLAEDGKVGFELRSGVKKWYGITA